MQRLTTIMAIYKLSWADVRACTEEGLWNQMIIDSLRRDFSEYCAQAAVRHRHDLLSYPNPPRIRPMQPRIRRCLQFGGELALAALRIRAPHLCLLPSGRPSARPDRRADCRWCGIPDLEYGRHILFCRELPPGLQKSKGKVTEAICRESGMRDITSHDHDDMQSCIMNFEWPHQQPETLKALLVLCRNVINCYAKDVPKWESKSLASFPVRRVRPVRSCTSTTELVEPS